VDQQDEQQRDDAAQQMLNLAAVNLAAGSGDEMDEKHGSGLAAASSSTEATALDAPMQDEVAGVPSDSDSDFLPDDEESDDSTDDISDTDDDEPPAVADGAASSSSAEAKPAKFKLDPSQDGKHQRHTRTIGVLKKDVETLLKDADLLCHGFHTCYLEAFHRKRRKFAPKEVFYANSWPMRTHYAHLHHHHGPNALLELQRQLGLRIDAHQATRFDKLQREHDRRTAHDMSEETKKQRRQRQVQKRAEAKQADAKTADVPGYKETAEQEEKRVARAAKAKRKAERSSKDEMEASDADEDDGPRAKKRQKSEKEAAAASSNTSEPAVEPFIASSFGSTPSKHGRYRTPSTQAMEMLADQTDMDDDDF
jgi:hypothetical protein